MEQRVRVGISSCLLGNPVRYNGGHTRDRFITDTLGAYFEYVPVCPEVEAGFGTPREALRLVGDKDSPRLVTSKSGVDHTDRMLGWARQRLSGLEKEDLCGFIFMNGSPSSGMERVKVYGPKGMPVKNGVGVFARAFMEHFPLLPVEEDGRLHDPRLRENFIERVFVFKRWREVCAERPTVGRLVAFHTRHKLQLLAHSTELYREAGKLVASAKKNEAEEAYRCYRQILMAALRLKTTDKKNANVLMHILGYFKDHLTRDEKQEVLEIIEHYRQGHVPLIVPVTLLNHFVRKYDEPYLRDQYYLNPHPVELQLRNHV